MAAAWKYVKWTLIGLTGLLLALVLFLAVWIDPNDYKDDITKAVKDNTGLVLAIKGDIGWSIYPALGFQVADVSLATAEGEAPLASVGKAAVSVQLLPLFRKEVNVRTLYLDGAKANLVVDESGKGNWEALTASKQAAEAEQPAEEAGPAPTIRLPKMVITNTVLDYDDRQAKSHYTVSVTELVGENVALGQEFPLHLVAAMDDHKGLVVKLDTRAFVLADPDNETYGLRALELKSNIAGILSQPFDATLNGNLLADMKKKQVSMNELLFAASGLALGKNTMSAKVQGAIAADLGADTAKVGPLNFELGAPLKGTLALDVANLTKELAFNGSLAVAPFNAKNLMRDFGIEPPKTTDPAAMTRVALKTALSGTTKSAMLDGLVITLDDSTIKGKAGLTDLESKAILFDLALDAINADRYLPPPAPAAAAAAPVAAGKPEPLLPVETLRALNLDGKLHAGRITAFELPMTALALGVRAAGGDIVVNPISAGVLEGTIRGDARIDARGAEPRITSNLLLDRIEVGGLVKRFSGKDLLVGKTTMKLDIDATGNDIDTLMKKASGNLNLGFADALLKGVNINNVLSETLTQQLGQFSMLVPDYQQKLPKELHEDTAITALAAAATLKDGVATIPEFRAGITDGDIKGGGEFNLLTRDFDYRLGMRTARLKDSKYFANAEFPVRCKGNIAESAAGWCRPDSKAISEMLKKAAQQAAKDRVAGEVAKELGIEASDADALKEKAKEQLDTQKKEAKKKAKEGLEKEVNKALQKYF